MWLVYKVRMIHLKLNMHNFCLGTIPVKQGSSFTWFGNPSHHVQLAVCAADVEVSDFICFVVPISHRFPQYNSMVSFLAAFLIQCFQNSSTVTCSLIGSLCGVIAVLVGWCIWTSWEEQPPSDAKPTEELLSFEEEEEEYSEERQKNFTFEVITEPTQEPQPSSLGLRLPLSFNWPSFLHRQRQSYDSNGTVVENP
jgi:hypothetical protein